MRKTGCIILCFCLCALMSLTAFAQSAETVTVISFPNDNAVPEENLSVSGYGDKDSGYAPSMLNGRLYASVSGTDLRKLEWSKGEYAGMGSQPVMTGGTKNPWGNGAYLEVRVSTTGYENISFSALLGATKKGPRDYKLQYSTDGDTFTDIAGQFFTIPTNKTMYQAFDNVSLPANCGDVAMLYIRIAVSSNMMVNGTAGLIGSTGGETAINQIVVSGTPIAIRTTATTAEPDAKSSVTTVLSTTSGTEDSAAIAMSTTSNTGDFITTMLSTTPNTKGSANATSDPPLPVATETVYTTVSPTSAHTSTTSTATSLIGVQTGEASSSIQSALLILIIATGSILCLKNLKA